MFAKLLSPGRSIVRVSLLLFLVMKKARVAQLQISRLPDNALHTWDM